MYAGCTWVAVRCLGTADARRPLLTAPEQHQWLAGVLVLLDSHP